MFTPPKNATKEIYTFFTTFFLVSHSDPEYCCLMQLSQWLDISLSAQKVAVNKVYNNYN